MSYNILSQTLAEAHPHLYPETLPNNLRWSQRVNLILDEIQSLDPSLVCLQEVDQLAFRSSFSPFLAKLGYHCSYKKRTNSSMTDGCALFWKTSCFELVDRVNVQFKDDSGDNPFLCRDNVGIIAILKVKLPDNVDVRICVATTHFLFNPKRGYDKLAQMSLFLNTISSTIQKHSAPSTINAIPVLIAGDFNMTPDSPLYLFWSTGSLKVDLYDEKLLASTPLRPTNRSPKQSETEQPVCHAFKLSSIYGFSKDVRHSHFSPVDGHEYFTTSHSATLSLVDYIFFGALKSTEFYRFGYTMETNNREKQRWHQTIKTSLTNVQEQVSKKKRKQWDEKIDITDLKSHLVPCQVVQTSFLEPPGHLPNLPTAFLPSDHISILAEFMIKIGDCELEGSSSAAQA